jgi:hypothetical protein
MSYFSGIANLGRNIAVDGATLDAHVTNFNNPHAVTASQVGNTVAQWNANLLQGVPVSSTVPTSNQTMRYNSTSSQWEPSNLSAQSPLSFNNGVLSIATGTTSGTVAVGNDARFATAEEIPVKASNPGAGEFTSISAALASITDASATKPYVITIGPGLYNEPPLVMKPYVALRGADTLSTIIHCTNQLGPVVTGADFAAILYLTVSGAVNTNGVGLYYAGQGLGTGATFAAKFCNFTQNYLAVQLFGNNAATTLGLTNCSMNNNFMALQVSNNPNIPTILIGSTLVINNSSSPDPDSLVHITGQGVVTYLTNMIVNYINAMTTTGFLIENGAQVNLFTLAVFNLLNGIVISNQGTPPTVYLTANEFTNCKYNVLVNHPQAIGSFSGVTDISKMYINLSSPFKIEGHDPNTLYVSPKNLDFHTIASAIAHITPTITINIVNGTTAITSTNDFNIELDGVVVSGPGIPTGTTATYVDESNMTLSTAATSTGPITAQFVKATVANKYIIDVGPAIYVESATINLPQYVSILGSSNAYIQIADPTQDVIHLASDTTLRNLNIMAAAGPGATAIVIDSATDVLVTDVTIITCDIGIKLLATTAATQALVQNFAIIGQFSKGVYLDGRVTTSVAPVTFVGSEAAINVNGGSPNIFEADGPYADLVMSAVNIIGNGQCNGCYLTDGANMFLSTINMLYCYDGMLVDNVGSGPGLQVTNVLVDYATNLDLNILHPQCTGVVDAVLTRTKVYVDPNCTISLEYLDPTVNGSTTIGNFYLGPSNPSSVEVRDILYRTSPMGVFDGGLLTVGSGLSVNVSAGSGYLVYTVNPQLLKKYSWSDSTVSLPASSTSFIYVDLNGNLTYGGSEPSLTQSIYLGRVRTTATGIEFIDPTGMVTSHIDNKTQAFERNAIRAVVATGLLTTVDTSLQVSVGSGQYYFAETEFNPSGGSPITFNAYYHSGGAWTINSNQTGLDNSQYDNGTDLTPIPTGDYTKHSLYMIGDGVNEHYFLVYGQAVYTSQSDAQSGPFPAPPNYFVDSVILLAGIIVQQGTPTFSIVVDQRPTITTNATALTSTLIHGNLLGLTADDHKQYLLVSGTRAMGGDLNMGNFNLANANTVNGVTVQAHASRHLPNGADPLLTAAPTINLNANTSNFGGVQNSFARSDHVHAIDTGNPVAIGTSNQPGVLSQLARADHVHAGIGAVTVDSGSQRTGIINLISGSGVTVTDNGNNSLTFSSTSGSFQDNTTFIVGHTDTTKKIGFNVSSATTNTTTTQNFSQTQNRVITYPDATDTLVANNFPATLTNKNLVDTSTVIVNAVDPTKQLGVNLSNQASNAQTTLAFAASANQTVTFPDGTDTVVTTNAAQTLTNKSLTDTTTNIVNTTDPTKQLGFDLSGATSGAKLTLSAPISQNQTLTVPDTTDTLVTQNLSQALTQKTLTDPSNNVTASSLFAGAGSTTINVATAAAPTIGQVLTATGSNQATWQTPTGEANTAANVGNSGVGLFLNKVGVVLQFKDLAAGSSKITITNDPNNNNVVIDAVEANFNLNNQSGTLSVSKGGTGDTTLTAGTVLIGNGTGAVQATKPAPSGNFVGDSDGQTLTNKTLADASTTFIDATDPTKQLQFDISGSTATSVILRTNASHNTTLSVPDASTDTDVFALLDTPQILTNKTAIDPSNNLAAQGLLSATTNVVVSGSLAPTSGQVLTATGSTAAAWQTPSVTASNLTGVISVTNGGTGMSTLTAGDVLVGNGAGPIQATKPAPSGDFVGTTDNQVLTNKTALDPSNNIAAQGLLSATTNVVVSGSAAPLPGQILTALDGNHATWQTPSVSSVDGILPVMNGGTGVGSLTSGNVLIGNGTNPVLTTKAAPSGNFVGDSDVQTLTNKIAIDPSNNLAAKGLLSATTNVNVSGSVAPTNGQVLTATDTTHAIWQTPSVTAANISGVIAVANGGTGTSILTSGNVLIGNGTGSVQTVKAAPSGNFVGSSDTQNLTNKTITDPSNTVTSTGLFAGSTTVNVSGSTVPSTGQVLTATDSAHATWQTPSISTVSGILPVPNGGTGMSTLTSGNVLVGNGTGGVLTTKAAPSGNFVGDTDTQTLTNKTVTDPSNNLAARGLLSATTNVNVSGSPAPSSGQVLTATSGTSATWQTPTIAASNISGIVAVTNGGTGVSNLTSGNVLVGNGTTAVTTTKAAPNGNFVGDTDIQTLTHKTLTDPSNTVTSTGLFTTTTTVNTSTAVAPTTGQVLMATSSTAATWQTPSVSSVSGVLPVSNGGTGTSTLTSGNVLVGNGTTTVQTTKAAPNGNFVGDTDIQTLTHKTLTDPSNTVTSTGLFSTTTTVNTSAATAPNAGQILTATSGTAATWQTPSVASVSGVLPVSNGGTGVSTLTSGNVLVGNGTGVVITNKAAPNGNFVGDIDTQTLTHKTLTDPSNTITANGLFTTTTTVNTAAATAPSTGQILTATSNTTATWQTPSVSTVAGVLPVANGGTGVSSLTVGNVLVGNGTGAVQTTKAAPSSSFVGTSDSQNLTNKTITDPSNTITSTGLFAGSVTVNVSGSTVPTTGQVLAATSSTAATWQTPTVTASNITGVLPVTNGGTGQSTYTKEGIVYYDGTELNSTAAGTAGQVLICTGSTTAPSFITPTAGTGLTVTSNATTHQYSLSAPVSVANGGTGVSTLTSGNVLVGNGASAVQTTKVAPTGAFVGTTDTQTLTNKTITDAGSTVTSTGLFSATTTVNTSASTAPTTGQVLTATSSTAATWQTLSVNASNISGILPVTNGGTGTSTLTSGNVLIGNGTGAVQTTKAAPTGTFVGTTDTQTLTNKTITDASNNVAATSLLTTGSPVNVAAAAPPSTGYALIATSATQASWQSIGVNIPFWIITDKETTSTNGGTFNNGAHTGTSGQTRTLNTITGSSNTSIQLAVSPANSNQILIQPGTYHLNARCPAYQVDSHQAFLQNISTSTAVSVGTSEYSSSTVAAAVTNSIIEAYFVVSSATVFEIQHRCQTTKSMNGFGIATGFGPYEVYTVVTITKLA